MKKISLFSILLLISGLLSGQIPLTNGSPSASENFDGMAALLPLPTNWRMHASTASPTWAGGSTSVTQQASMGTPNTGGTYNWGQNGAVERAVGSMTSSGFVSPNNLMAQFVNNGTSNILSLSVAYDAERYRVNTTAVSVQFYYSLNGTAWTAVSAGDIAAASFPTGASSYTFVSPLIVNVAAFSVNGLAIAPASNFYLRWTILGGGNTNSQGIGLDNVSVTATFAAAGPEIQLQQPVNTNIACGTTLDYGTVGSGASSSKTVRIKNFGTSALNLTTTPLVITGPDAAEYDISSQPPISSIPANGYVDFVVDFNPTSVGVKTATISIDNDDSNENPCAVNLTGTGIPNEPEIQLEYPVATPVACGAATMAFGNVAVGNTSPALTFRIKNPGALPLTLTTLPLVISGADPTQFAISVQPVSPIAASSTAFTDASVTFSPTSAGAKTAIISIDNDDSGENPCAINLSGTGTQMLHFRTVATGNWNATGTWETSPDLVIWTPAASTPTTAELTVQILSGHDVTVTANVSVDELTVASGGQLTVNSGVTFTIANGASDDVTVSGIFRNNGGTLTVTGTLVFTGTGLYQLNYSGAGGAPNTIPTATWSTGSTCEVLSSGTAIPSGLSQSFHHFIWNHSTQTTNLNFTGGLATVNGNLSFLNDGSGSIRLTGATALTLLVGGDLTIAAGVSVDLSNSSASPIVNLKGNLVVAGTLTETTSGTPAFNLNGIANQDLSAVGTIANTIPVVLNNAAGATLLTDITLPNNLTCTTGKLSLGNFHLTVSGPTMSGSTNSYVKTNGAGELRHAVTSGNISFPIGNSTYNPVSLAFSAGSATLGVLVLDVVNSDGLVGSPVVEKVVNRTWDINGVIPAGETMSCTTQWVPANELANFDRNLCYVSHYVGGWSGDTPGAAGGGPTTFTRTRNGIASLSPFAVASGQALPLEWVSFSATREGKMNRLDWQTASETNVRQFLVERSLDNQNWFEIDKKQAIGNSQQLNSYSANDEKPSAKAWYRLRSIDFDGRESFSKVIFVERETGSGSVQILPNPADDLATILLNSDLEKEVELTVFDVLGKAVLTQKLNLQKGENRLWLDVSMLPEGIFQVSISGFPTVQLVKN